MSGGSGRTTAKTLARCMAASFAAMTAISAAVSPARAQDAAGFYKGKTVKFVVGYGTGGGFDAYARMIAAPLGKALDATVVVENQPGAGGLVALNRVAAAPADGLTIMIVDGTPAALGQLLGTENVRYDLAKIGHLGMIGATRFVWLVNPASPVTTLADALKPGVKIRWAGGGATDGASGSASVACEALRIDCHVVLGYKGSSDMLLAVQRNEMDALFLSESSASLLVKSTQARAVLTVSRDRSKLLPDVPTVFESAKLDTEQQWWMDFRANLNDLGRILVVTGGTSADRLAFLQGSVKKVLTDPVMLAEGARTGRHVEFQEPEVARKKAVSVLEGVTPEQKERIRTVALTKFVK